MTLSRFLRDYLYIGWAATGAAAGPARGAVRHHDARRPLARRRPTFVAWGALHGLGLGAGVLWRRASCRMPALLGWFLTALFVVLTWVLFRATSFEAALAVLQGPVRPRARRQRLQMAHHPDRGRGGDARPERLGGIHRLPPHRGLAAAFAVLFVIVLLKIGDDANYEFIYFQF